MNQKERLPTGNNIGAVFAEDPIKKRGFDAKPYRPEEQFHSWHLTTELSSRRPPMADSLHKMHSGRGLLRRLVRPRWPRILALARGAASRSDSRPYS